MSVFGRSYAPTTTVKSFAYDDQGRTTSVTTSAGTTSLSYEYATRDDRIVGITYPSSATNSFAYNCLDTRRFETDSSGTSTEGLTLGAKFGRMLLRLTPRAIAVVLGFFVLQCSDFGQSLARAHVDTGTPLVVTIMVSVHCDDFLRVLSKDSKAIRSPV